MDYTHQDLLNGIHIGIAIHCNGHILISFVFLQFTSLHSVFHSFHGLMNSINWPASSVWVFIAQLGEHCSANAEATGSNPIEAPKVFFSGYFRNCLNCDSLRWSHTHFIYWVFIYHFGKLGLKNVGRKGLMQRILSFSKWYVNGMTVPLPVCGTGPSCSKGA